MDFKTAAATLGCTPSQLTRLLKDEPRAFLQFNQARTLLGLHPLRLIGLRHSPGKDAGAVVRWETIEIPREPTPGRT